MDARRARVEPERLDAGPLLLFCQGCKRFVAHLYLIARSRYRCLECAR